MIWGLLDQHSPGKDCSNCLSFLHHHVFFSLACSCLGLVQKSLSHDWAGGVMAGAGGGGGEGLLGPIMA